MTQPAAVKVGDVLPPSCALNAPLLAASAAPSPDVDRVAGYRHPPRHRVLVTYRWTPRSMVMAEVKPTRGSGLFPAPPCSRRRDGRP